jgi:hypothetical protein
LNTYTWDDLRLPLFLPLADLGVDLLPQFSLDLASISGKKSHKTLRSAIDNINFMQGDGMDHLFPLLNLAIGALYELGLPHKAHCRMAPSEVP